MDPFYVTDSTLSSRYTLYTRANVGEVFPDPVTPLTATSALWMAELGWREAWVRMGAFDPDEFPADEHCQLGVVAGYCYLNASLIRLFGVRAPGLTWQDMDAQFFGTQPGVPPFVEQPGDERADLTERIGGTFMAAMSHQTVDSIENLTAHKIMTRELRANRPDFTTMTNDELWTRFRVELLPHHQTLFCEHIFTTYMATVPVGIISAVATAVGRPDLILPIMAGIGEVDSAEPSHAMWALSRLDAGSVEFDAAFAAFLYEYGSRGPNEWETRSPTWETRPALALSAIDRMRAAHDGQNPARMNAQRAVEREAAAAELLAIVEADPGTHFQLSIAILASRAWLPGRERSKTNNIRLIHEMRMTIREIGTRMAANGAFDDIEDFGFITDGEMADFLVNPHSFTARVRERRAEYQQLQQLVPSFVFDSEPDHPSTWARRDDASAVKLAVGEVLVGMPGCTGIVEGRARVILDSNDPSELEPGDILVAPITDPSWTPLFVPAGGVVVDVGAPLSHAIIVSRELGIPCVISATDATRRIPNGSMIRVDGNTGVVTILSID
jgi:rifampicin phosphotransferase